MSGLFDELSWRGLVHTVSDPELPALLDKGGLVAYIGFDPTADSLHIGNLLQLCNLRRLQEAGHQVIALAGGATGMIGDPGGRSDERNLLSSDELATNLAGIKGQLEKFVPGAVFVDNADWTRSLTLLDFLRDVGKHFTINQMIAKEAVRTRIERPEQGISYTEFSYMLLQAMDYLHLFRAHGCRLQLGASDQWGNITMGIDLIRKVAGETAYGLVTPLVLRADGEKMGKSAGGETVWLDDTKTSHVDLFQYFLRVEDGLVGEYLRYFTWVPRERIEELDAATKERPEVREAQHVLAWEIAKLVHDEARADDARARSEAMFVARSGNPLEAARQAPTSSFPRKPLPLAKALELVKLCGSTSDARRQIQQGGVYVNEERVDDVDRVLDPDVDALDGQRVLLRRGKKNVHTVFFSAT